MLVLLPQLQQLLKHLHPLRLQLPGIHQLLVVLPPRAQVAFLRDELGGFAVVGFQEVDGFLPFGEPEFGLGHITFIKADNSSRKVVLRLRKLKHHIQNTGFEHLSAKTRATVLRPFIHLAQAYQME